MKAWSPVRRAPVQATARAAAMPANSTRTNKARPQPSALSQSQRPAARTRSEPRTMAGMAGSGLFESAERAGRGGEPGRIGDHQLALPRTERQQMELAVFAPDQAAEQIAPGGAGDEHVAVERSAELLGGEAQAPDLVAGSIIADAGEETHGDHAGLGPRRHDDSGAARRVGAVMVEIGGERQVLAVRKLDEIAGLDSQRPGDAV